MPTATEKPPYPNLTKQQRDPHPKLIEVRDRVRECGYTRRQAGSICDQLDDRQCEAILSATEDAAVLKVFRDVELPSLIAGGPSERVPEPNAEEAARFRRERRDIAKAIEKQYRESA